jgi:hypothetical protein
MENPHCHSTEIKYAVAVCFHLLRELAEAEHHGWFMAEHLLKRYVV